MKISLREWQRNGTQVVGEYCWAKDTSYGALHSAADQVPVRRSLHLYWTASIHARSRQRVLYIGSRSAKCHLHWTVRDFTTAYVGESLTTAYLRQNGVELCSDGRIMNWTRIGAERSCTAPAYAKRDWEKARIIALSIVDAGIGIKTLYLWNRSLDGCHYANPFVESTEIGMKERKKQMRKNKKERKAMKKNKKHKVEKNRWNWTREIGKKRQNKQGRKRKWWYKEEQRHRETEKNQYVWEKQ